MLNANQLLLSSASSPEPPIPIGKRGGEKMGGGGEKMGGARGGEKWGGEERREMGGRGEKWGWGEGRRENGGERRGEERKCGGEDQFVVYSSY